VYLHTISALGCSFPFHSFFTTLVRDDMLLSWISGAVVLAVATRATPVLYDGRAPTNLSESVFNDLSGPYVL
jgi:hypothetical protein